MGAKRATKPWKATGAKLDRIKQLHALGYSNNAIARAVGMSPAGMAKVAERNGLASNANSEHTRERRRKATRQAMIQRHGVGSVAALRNEEKRIATWRAGWPAGCYPGVAQYLECLLAGPKTRGEIARETGRDYFGVWRELTTAEDAGWVTKEKVGAAWVFTLAPAVRRRREMTPAVPLGGVRDE